MDTLEHTVGDTLRIALDLTDDSDAENIVPIDTTGWTFEVSGIDTERTPYNFTVNTLDASIGSHEIYMSAADTGLWKPNLRITCAITVTTASGDVDSDNPFVIETRTKY